MGYRELTLKLPTDYTEEQLRRRIGKELKIRNFSCTISSKSLDARKKNAIHWLLRVGVVSDELAGGEPERAPELVIPRISGTRRAVVVGSGPAGIFAALVLQQAGISVTLIERGTEVTKRAEGIRAFESTGVFNPASNYAFGEGGAGTFSDGKLTSRSKHITREKEFMLNTYIMAGAPEEIRYLAHPHLGSDNLRVMAKNLRQMLLDLGGTIHFETMLLDLSADNGSVAAAITSAGPMTADFFVIAPGHSAHETYRMLIGKGVAFRTKSFAIGCRVEHPQELINLAQWGCRRLPGVKAAEYRLTSPGDGRLPVYTFCMCPGGVVVPAAAYEETNIVNGMSRYRRNGVFANAACVAGINLNSLLGRELDPLEALEWLGALEESFYTATAGYRAPFCTVRDFLDKTMPSGIPDSSYPLGLKPAPLWNMLPAPVATAIAAGLRDFTRTIKGFETGTLLGLESKTSSPIQVLREPDGRCTGFDNLYVVGEGSGYAGGIISSGSDGIRAAMHILARC